MFLPELHQKSAGDSHFLPGVGTVEASKPLVVGKAEDEGKIKWNGFAWWHLECAGSTLSVNGKGEVKAKPALRQHLECRVCGTEFKKQEMLSHQMEPRQMKANSLLPTVYRDKGHPCRFFVRSSSQPKAYIVYRDNHGNWTCPCQDWASRSPGFAVAFGRR